MVNNRKVKICRVATVPFSFVSQLMSQIEYIHNKGMEVFLISSAGQEMKENQLLKGITYDTIEIPRLLSPFKDIKALIKLIYYFRKHKFDIVHSITPKAGLLTAIAALISGVPVRLHTWTGQPWVTKSGLIKMLAKFSDKVIGVLNTKCYADSRSQSFFLISENIISPTKIEVIGYSSIAGVNLNRFHDKILSALDKKKLREKLCIERDAKIVIFIGRITQDKGIRELEIAFNKIIKSGYNAHLLLVGPLDEECGGRKTINIDNLIENPKVTYTGYTESPEIYLSISDILCLPSYREGFGTVVIEASAMGLPSIGTKINGLKDAIEHNKTGLLVEPYNDEDLYNAMFKLLNDEKLVDRMGANAQERCRKLFDADIINQKVFEEYEFLCKEL